jgi:hypothetical protein
MKFTWLSAAILFLGSSYSLAAQGVNDLETRLSRLEQDQKELRQIIALQKAELDQVLGGPGQRICSGSTPKGAGWTAFSGRGATIRVNISSCGFKETPRILTSLGGKWQHWMVAGPTSVYNPSHSSFDIYLLNIYDKPIHDLAKSEQWFVEWIAIGK